MPLKKLNRLLVNLAKHIFKNFTYLVGLSICISTFIWFGLINSSPLFLFLGAAIGLLILLIDKTTNNKPAPWQNPAWIIAIGTIVTGLITLPEEVGNFLSREQEVNVSKQKQEFDIVNTTLAEQGDERVFVLRYLASTLDDIEARNWATEEVGRLDRIVDLKNDRDKSITELQKKETELRILTSESLKDKSQLSAKVTELRSAINLKNLKILELEKKAGLNETHGSGRYLLLIIDILWEGNIQDLYAFSLSKPVDEVTPPDDIFFCAPVIDICVFLLENRKAPPSPIYFFPHSALPNYMKAITLRPRKEPGYSNESLITWEYECIDTGDQYNQGIVMECLPKKIN